MEANVEGAGERDDGRNAVLSSGEALGRVISVNGSQASIGFLSSMRRTAHDLRPTVGNFVGIVSGRSVLIGVITEVSIDIPAALREQGYFAAGKLDLLGEIKEEQNRRACFTRGVREYPAVGDASALLTKHALELVYGGFGSDMIKIGELNQDSSVDAHIDVKETLTKHFAVLGTTGVGKSTAVALILQRMLAARPDLRILLLDAHNEYAQCFGDIANVVNPSNMKLPFWLFNFEELADVIFAGRPGDPEELEILSEVLPLAKASYSRMRGAQDRLWAKRSAAGYTVDTPVPYVMQDMVALIDERMGKLENRSSRMKFHKLISRIDAVRNDPRYGFMFANANVGGDTMGEVISQLFRLPAHGRPMTIMQLAGFPAEVVDAVVSVLGRMAFEFGLWSDGAVPLLFVCEEAHRYAAADRNLGFGPTRKSISRIAKEGRKYGVFLGLVTQRPAELDATILSQCSTLFVMRMANDRDQAIVRAAVSDAAANLLDFVPTLGTAEVFAFGEGIAMPARLRFTQMPPHLLPRSEAVGNAKIDPRAGINPEFVASVVDRWRGAMMSQKVGLDESGDVEPVMLAKTASPQITPASSPPRPSLLKKPLIPGL
jgi:DNA helicase HerA-like ATPase